MDIQTAFCKSSRVQLVRALEARYQELSECLEWIDSSEEAAPIEEEARIIQATLRAIKAEHAPGYFDPKPSSDGDRPDALDESLVDGKQEEVA